MKTIIALLIISFISSCSSNTEKTDEKEITINPDWNYKEVENEYLDSLLIDICSVQGLEFTDLYPVLDSISSDNYENLILIDSLKVKGFEVTNWGRGNWMEGPRMVNFTMSNKHCECRVDKLYYTTEQEYRYKVTERIACEIISN